MSVAAAVQGGPAISRRIRTATLGAVLAIQLLLFLVFLPRHPAVLEDNVRYETAAWLLASGRGDALPAADDPDLETRGWACARHPAWCDGDVAPTAIYPPGYVYFIAGIEKVFGRDLRAILGAQLALLLVLFAAFEALAARRLGRAGYAFAVAVAATYPFLARQATLVMSDHLHAVLLFLAIVALEIGRPGVRRGLAVGVLLSLATLVRPYSLLCAPFLAAAVLLGSADETAARADDTRLPAGASHVGKLAALWRRNGPEALSVLAAFCFPIALWAWRNEVVFGHFIPFSTAGIGQSLYLNKVEWTIGSALEPGNATAIHRESVAVGGGDPVTVAAGKRLGAAALAWMAQNPGKVALATLFRVPRLWISAGYQGQGTSRALALLVAYLGALLALGCAGMWLRRRDRAWWAMASVILVYWAFLLHTPAEARRTLPLRLPMLLFAGVAVDRLASRWSEWKARRSNEATAPRLG